MITSQKHSKTSDNTFLDDSAQTLPNLPQKCWKILWQKGFSDIGTCKRKMIANLDYLYQRDGPISWQVVQAYRVIFHENNIVTYLLLV